VSLLIVLKTLSGDALGETTSNATVNATNPRAVERPAKNVSVDSGKFKL
jgi:hypothetical protein